MMADIQSAQITIASALMAQNVMSADEVRKQLLADAMNSVQIDAAYESIRANLNAYGAAPCRPDPPLRLNPHIIKPPEYRIIPPKKTNCRNCGAPVDWYRCEYCGTVND